MPEPAIAAAAEFRCTQSMLLGDERGAPCRAGLTVDRDTLPAPELKRGEAATWRSAEVVGPEADAQLAGALVRLAGPWQPDPVATVRPRTFAAFAPG